MSKAKVKDVSGVYAGRRWNGVHEKANHCFIVNGEELIFANIKNVYLGSTYILKDYGKGDIRCPLKPDYVEAGEPSKEDLADWALKDENVRQKLGRKQMASRLEKLARQGIEDLAKRFINQMGSKALSPGHFDTFGNIVSELLLEQYQKQRKKVPR